MPCKPDWLPVYGLSSGVSSLAEPRNTVYTAIEDGFLAPCKVVRIDFDKDLQGWRPEHGKTDKHGLLIEDRIFNQKDFDRELVLEQRTESSSGMNLIQRLF